MYRSFILVSYKAGKSGACILKDLESAYGDRAPSQSTVYYWIDRFKKGFEDIEDEARPGPPITATRPENIERVRQLIADNPYISLKRIEMQTSFSRGTIQNIIHNHLNLRKITSRWVPHNLTSENKARRVAICQKNLVKFDEGKWRISDIMTGDESWIYHRQIRHKQSNASWIAPGEPPRTIVRRDRFEPKSMFTIFFKSTGLVLIDCMDKGESIDADYYIENCLKPALKTVRRQRPASGTTNFKILHDNAKPHTAKSVKSYLDSEGITIIDHPPYSPDLAPCDFWLFDRIKQHLDDHMCAESLTKQITNILMSISQTEYHRAFEKYLERMRLCVENEGEYFEHLIK